MTLYKTDNSLRRTLSAGPKGVHLGESWLYVICNNALCNVCTHTVHVLLRTDCPWVTKDDSKQKLYWNASSNNNYYYCSFYTLTDIIRQFNPLLKGASVTSQSMDNIPYNDDLNVAFVGASARSEYIKLIQRFLHFVEWFNNFIVTCECS